MSWGVRKPSIKLEQHRNASEAVATVQQCGEAGQLRGGSGAGAMAGICPPWAGSCRRGQQGSSPEGAAIFLLVIGGSGSWQKLTLVCWLLVGKGGGWRSSPHGWQWWDGDSHRTVPGNSPTAAQQITKCSSAGWKLPGFQFKEQIMDYFPPKILEKRCASAERADCYSHLVMGMELRGRCLLHQAALKQGHKQPVRLWQWNACSDYSYILLDSKSFPGRKKQKITRKLVSTKLTSSLSFASGCETNWWMCLT